MAIKPIYVLAGQSNANPTRVADRIKETLSRIDDNFGFVHDATGGTALSQNDKNNGDWSIDSQGELYDTLLRNIDAEMQRVADAGDTPVLNGFMWVQGEADAKSLSTAEAYEENLLAFIADLRSHYGDDFKFVIAELKTTDESKFAYHEIVRAAQHRIAEAYDNVVLLETDDFPLSSDGVHYSGKGRTMLGDALANMVAEDHLAIQNATEEPVIDEDNAIYAVGGKARGDNGDDLIIGSAGNDSLVGRGGNDMLYGMDGDDRLYGNDGSDTIFGGNGDDFIAAGKDNDVMTGGAGEDRFVFDLSDGINTSDVITDFENGLDLIMLRDLKVMSVADENGGTMIQFDNNSTVFLENVSSSNIDIDDFLLRGTSEFIV